jgi:hypothetical protein
VHVVFVEILTVCGGGEKRIIIKRYRGQSPNFTYTKSSLFVFELIVRRVNPRVINLVVAIARKHNNVFRSATGKKTKKCRNDRKNEVDFEHSLIVDGGATSLGSQHIVVGQGEELRWSDVWFVAAVDAEIEGFVDVLLEIVKAEVVVGNCRDSAKVLDIPIGNELLGVDVLHVPVEGFAFQLVSEDFSVRDVANVWVISQIWSVHVQKLLILVHPDLCHSHGVDSVRVLVVGEAVGMELPEDVPDSRAGNRLECSSAHPNAETLPINQTFSKLCVTFPSETFTISRFSPPQPSICSS